MNLNLEQNQNKSNIKYLKKKKNETNKELIPKKNNIPL